jgi:hypothetical protein
VNIELPFDDVGDDLDALVARIDSVLDESFMREVDEALARMAQPREVEVVVEPLAG